VRVCCQGETPSLSSDATSQEEDLGKKYGIPAVNKDGSGQSNYND
jgi:taurine dioxygenase